MSDSLYENILASKPSSEEKASQEQILNTWLIFNASGETYAIESQQVKELLRNNEVFPLPFVPAYIKGVLNCYGEPYAIVDFAMLTGGEPQKSRLFMILNGKDSLSIQITDIIEFQTDSTSDLQKIAAPSENSYFLGAITYDGRSIPVLNIEGITAKIRADLENS